MIPVAGRGTRMLPATKTIPKELVPLVGKPAVQRVVESAAAAGIEEVIFVTSPGKSPVESHFLPDSELEDWLLARGKHELLAITQAVAGLVRVRTVVQSEPLGLGHAVLMARAAVGDDAFAVILPDELVVGPMPVLAQCLEVSRSGEPVIGIVEVPDADVPRYGIVKVRDDGPTTRVIEDMVEKPTLADAPSRFAITGPYVLPPEIFEDLARVAPRAGGEIQLTDALRALASRRRVLGRIIEGERLDVGNPLGFVQANVVLGLLDPVIGESLREWLRGRGRS